ncbi:hypothetical protein [Clostridium sulfidigenes]|uniref:hypothetical protein n=1 Tax=Clostridium sulfidigenes TaxID=318464 RepID=UPI003F8A26A0
MERWRKITRKEKKYTMEKMKKIFEKKYIITKERQMEIISSRESIRDFFTKELMSKCNYCFFARSVKSLTLVVKAKENKCALFELESWENMTQNRLEFYEIPGTHDTILAPPNVEKLSEIILQYLDKT